LRYAVLGDFQKAVRSIARMDIRTLPPDYFDLIGSVIDETLIIHRHPLLPPAAVDLDSPVHVEPGLNGYFSFLPPQS